MFVRLPSAALLAALCSLCAPAVHAQAPSSTPAAMTLQEALAYSAAHQPALLAVQARLQAAQRETDIPRGLWLPRAAGTLQVLEGTANNSTASFLSVPGLDLPRIGGTKAAPPSTWSPSPSTLAAVGVRQELFDFGRIAALQTVFDSAVQVESARADEGRLDVSLLVVEAYYGVHAAKAVLQAAESAAARALLHRDQAAAGVRSGMRPPIEVTRAEADLSRFEVGRVRAAGGVELAKALFAAAVGVPTPALDAAGPIPPVPVAPAVLDPSSAEARDPGVRVAAALREQQHAATRVAEAELLPELSLSAGLSGRAGGADSTSGARPDGNGWLPDVPNWDVGILLTWPLYDASSRARTSASRARELERAAEVDAARLRLSSAVLQAAQSFKVATDSLPALERAAAAAAANQAQGEARFRAGLGSSVELADAEALRLQGEIDLAVGKFEQARSRARLSRALAEGL